MSVLEFTVMWNRRRRLLDKSVLQIDSWLSCITGLVASSQRLHPLLEIPDPVTYQCTRISLLKFVVSTPFLLCFTKTVNKEVCWGLWTLFHAANAPRIAQLRCASDNSFDWLIDWRITWLCWCSYLFNYHCGSEYGCLLCLHGVVFIIFLALVYRSVQSTIAHDRPQIWRHVSFHQNPCRSSEVLKRSCHLLSISSMIVVTRPAHKR